MIESNENRMNPVSHAEAPVVTTAVELAGSPAVELHLEGEDDYGLHLRDHRLHINGTDSLLSDVKW